LPSKYNTPTPHPPTIPQPLYGFYFPDDQTASETAEAVTSALGELKASSARNRAPPPPPPTAVPATEEGEKTYMQLPSTGKSLASAVEAAAGAGSLDVSEQVLILFGALISQSTNASILKGGKA